MTPADECALERAADGDARAAAALPTDPVAMATVREDRAVAGLLAVALDPVARATAVAGVLAALDAAAPARRAHTLARVQRRLRPRWPWWAAAALTAAACLVVVVLLPRDRVRLEDGSRVFAGPGARWSASSDDTGELLTLTAGMVTVQAAPQTPGRRLRVRTALAEVTVIGTAFAVAVEPEGTRVAVSAGRVAVRGSRIADHELGPGESLLVPAAWRADFADPAGLRRDPIAWWLGVPDRRADGADERPVLVAAPAEAPDEGWIGVRARLRGGYRVAAGDRLRLRLHSEAPGTLRVLVEHARERRNFQTALAVDAGWNEREVPLADLRAILPPRRPLAAGDTLAVLLVYRDDAASAFALERLELLPPP